MTDKKTLPRLLIIDDLFGRTIADGPNEERRRLCGQYLLKDVTGDISANMSSMTIKSPIAEAVFFRGQKPIAASIGDTVENDLGGTLQKIREGWENPPPGKPPWTLVLLDLCFYTGKIKKDSSPKGMPEGRPGDDNPRKYFGINILEAIKKEFPNLPVVILSSKPRNEISQEFSYKGALGFLARSQEESPARLKEYIWKYGLFPDPDGEIVGHSIPLLLALRMARIKALTHQNILIRGERGTGKGLLARYINRQRSEKNTFVVANSSILSPELFASELFGYLKGAFTGADKDKSGLIEKANDGDLFFDEIGDMLPQVQAGILNVLQDRMFIPIGGTEPKAVNVRFLSATNKDIDFLVDTNHFRRDLYDRLREGGVISIPPLRERKEDIPLLVDHFFFSAIDKWKKTEASRRGVTSEEIERRIHLKNIHQDTYEQLKKYDWPGNVREISNCIFNAVHQHLDVEYLSPHHLQMADIAAQSMKSVTSNKVQDAEIKYNEEISTSPHLREEQTRFPVNVDELITVLSNTSFEKNESQELFGKLPSLQEVYAKLLARYLKAALQKTSKSTPQNPGGEVQITPAIKLISGQPGLTTAKAADIIKRIFAIAPGIKEYIFNDPILKDAYEDAYRLRPKRGRKKDE
jgi:DNA-binding NtrC family response regulator